MSAIEPQVGDRYVLKNFKYEENLCLNGMIVQVVQVYPKWRRVVLSVDMPDSGEPLSLSYDTHYATWLGRGEDDSLEVAE